MKYRIIIYVAALLNRQKCFLITLLGESSLEHTYLSLLAIEVRTYPLQWVICFDKGISAEAHICSSCQGTGTD